MKKVWNALIAILLVLGVVDTSIAAYMVQQTTTFSDWGYGLDADSLLLQKDSIQLTVTRSNYDNPYYFTDEQKFDHGWMRDEIKNDLDSAGMTGSILSPWSYPRGGAWVLYFDLPILSLSVDLAVYVDGTIDYYLTSNISTDGSYTSAGDSPDFKTLSGTDYSFNYATLSLSDAYHPAPQFGYGIWGTFGNTSYLDNITVTYWGYGGKKYLTEVTDPEFLTQGKLTAAVPEPTSLLLLGSGLIGLIGLRRKLT